MVTEKNDEHRDNRLLSFMAQQDSRLSKMPKVCLRSFIKLYQNYIPRPSEKTGKFFLSIKKVQWLQFLISSILLLTLEIPKQSGIPVHNFLNYCVQYKIWSHLKVCLGATQNRYCPFPLKLCSRLPYYTLCLMRILLGFPTRYERHTSETVFTYQ